MKNIPFIHSVLIILLAIAIATATTPFVRLEEKVIPENVYGEIFYHNDTATSLNFAVDGLFYYLYALNDTQLKGFTSKNIGWGLNSSMIAGYDGIYHIWYSASGDGQNNHVYHATVFIDEINIKSCETHKKMSAGGDVVTMNGHCIVQINENQEVSLRIADIGGTGTGNYYSSNLNLMRIDDV